MSEPKKVLWLSRHAMTEEQLEVLGHWFDEEITVTQVNAVYSADSEEAVEELVALGKEYDALAGVFPGHIAAAYALLRFKQELPEWYKPNNREYLPMFVPVSVPAPAKEGEVRGNGFDFSHWEQF
jgi:hypothetical protein